MPENHDYIRNCIANAMSQCAPEKQWELALAFANAVRLADAEGEQAAWTYLQVVAATATEGKYK